MALTKTSKYALRILGFMAINETNSISAHELYRELKIPEKYLRKMLTQLSKKGFIKSVHGRNGGYMLTKDPETIRLSDVIDAVEGLESISSCILGYEECAFDRSCPMHNLWEETRQKIISTLTNTTLRDIYKININC